MPRVSKYRISRFRNLGKSYKPKPRPQAAAKSRSQAASGREGGIRKDQAEDVSNITTQILHSTYQSTKLSELMPGPEGKTAQPDSEFERETHPCACSSHLTAGNVHETWYAVNTHGTPALFLTMRPTFTVALAVTGLQTVQGPQTIRQSMQALDTQMPLSHRSSHALLHMYRIAPSRSRAHADGFRLVRSVVTYHSRVGSTTLCTSLSFQNTVFLCRGPKASKACLH